MTNGIATLRAIFQDAESYGERLAQLLATSDLPNDVKDAFARLVLDMTPEQLQKFELLLRAHLKQEVQDELEHVFLAIRAQIEKYNLQKTAALHVANTRLDDIEQEFAALERANGKKSA